MSKSDDEFDDIVASFNKKPEGAEENLEFDNLWEAVEHHSKEMFPGNIPTTGLVIVVSVDDKGRKIFRYQTSPGVAEWDILGMIESVKMRIQADNVIDNYDFAEDEGEEFDD